MGYLMLNFGSLVNVWLLLYFQDPLAFLMTLFNLFDLVSLFNYISTSVGYLMPKSSLEKNNIESV